MHLIKIFLLIVFNLIIIVFMTQNSNERVDIFFLNYSISGAFLDEAKKQEIPLISVKTNTHETAELISKIVKKSKFDHALKYENTLELLLENLDLNYFKKSFEISTL